MKTRWAVAPFGCAIWPTEDDLKIKIDRLRSHHDPLRAGLGLEPIDPEVLLNQLLEIAPKILPYVKPAWRVLDQAQKSGKRVLFEGRRALSSTWITAPIPM